MARDTILFIVNYRDWCAVWTEYLLQSGWRVRVAESVREADEYLSGSSDVIRLVLCQDWLEGRGANGPDFYHRHKEAFRCQNIPLILVTHWGQEVFLARMREDGMYILLIPCSLRELGALIKALTKESEDRIKNPSGGSEL